MTVFYAISYVAQFLAAGGQLLLKLGSNREGWNMVVLRLNTRVLLGLIAMIVSMLLNVRALSVIPLRDMAFILPTTYILVPVFSYIFLGERINPQTIAGTVIIVIGVVVFNLPI